MLHTGNFLIPPRVRCGAKDETAADKRRLDFLLPPQPTAITHEVEKARPLLTKEVRVLWPQRCWFEMKEGWGAFKPYLAWDAGPQVYPCLMFVLDDSRID